MPSVGNLYKDIEGENYCSLPACTQLASKSISSLELLISAYTEDELRHPNS